MNKRGASSLIATVLIISLVIVASFVVFSFGFELLRTLTGEKQTSLQTQEQALQRTINPPKK